MYQELRIYQKLRLLSGFFMLLSGVGVPWLTVQAADVNITINGSVVALPCNVATDNTTVDLGDLYKSDLATPGSSSPWVNINLSLNACPAGTTAVIASFSGPADSSGYYSNQGDAGNIAVELQDSAGNSLKSGIKKRISVDDATSTAIFSLKVRAVSVKGGPSAGSIKSVITITYTYA